MVVEFCPRVDYRSSCFAIEWVADFLCSFVELVLREVFADSTLVCVALGRQLRFIAGSQQGSSPLARLDSGCGSTFGFINQPSDVTLFQYLLRIYYLSSQQISYLSHSRKHFRIENIDLVSFNNKSTCRGRTWVSIIDSGLPVRSSSQIGTISQLSFKMST